MITAKDFLAYVAETTRNELWIDHAAWYLGKDVYITAGVSINYPPYYGFYIRNEAYSVAGEMGFGWWLVEHYLSYHVDCPDGCGLGETAGGG